MREPDFKIISPTGLTVFERYDWFSVFGWRVGVNVFKGADDADNFHTHPSTSFRLVLRGGYVEEMLNGELIVRRPGSFGLIRWYMAHRIERLLTHRSVSFFVYHPHIHTFRNFWRK